MKPILPPRLITTPVRQINPALLGTKAERDAFADEMIQREKEYEEVMSGLPESLPLSDAELKRLADADAEKNSEGRSWPVKPSRHDD